MPTQAIRRARRRRRRTHADRAPLVALPGPGVSLEQDEEFCVVQVGPGEDDWRRIRLHDYADIYSVPGLYEKVIYEILQCKSPETIRRLLADELVESGRGGADLRVLDLGAGNGIVGEELAGIDARFIVGIDIIDEAAAAAERDRPGIYADYHVVDLTDLDAGRQRELEHYRCNCLVSVAALGFGDIPARAFAAAYNLIEPDGWIAFNIKEEFLDKGSGSGFAELIRAMTASGALELRRRERYPHRLSTEREPIHYVALVGRKHRDVELPAAP